jgi:hypothetical protein
MKLLNFIDEGRPSGYAPIKPKIKLADKPYLFIAVPCGNKVDKFLLECSKELGGCGKQFILEGSRVPALMPIYWTISYHNTLMPLNVTQAISWHSGTLSSVARQILTKEAMRVGSTYILYWDDDTLPPALGLYTMFNFMQQHPEAGAIGAVCMTRQDPSEPVVYMEHGVGASWDFEMGPGAEPQHVFATGSGFLLARVEAIADVMDKMRADNSGTEVPVWMDEVELPDMSAGGTVQGRMVNWGHDIRFVHNLNKYGWPVYIDGRVLCGHLDVNTGTIYEVPDTLSGFTKTRQRLEAQNNAKNQIAAPGPLPFVEGIPADGVTENETQGGTSLGNGQDQEVRNAGETS